MKTNIRNQRKLKTGLGLRILIPGLMAGLLSQNLPAQDPAFFPKLSRNRFRSGEETLRAFAPVSEATRDSIIKLSVDGTTVALGTVMDTNGLALTKASEIKKGKLTCWLATERQVEAELLGIDEGEDIALVRVHAQGLQPIRWAATEVALGQWAITPGVAETPHAVGIVSALPRRIRPQRAFIGVQFGLRDTSPKIEEVMEGLGAEKAGLKAGDTILGVNDNLVTNRQQIVEILSEFRSGQVVKVQVQRAEERFSADVRMMTPPLGPPDRLVGEVSQRAEGFQQVIEHDTVLQPWLCGGPLVNLEGKAIGLNIARAGRVTTYALSAPLVAKIFENLKSKMN